jgi:DNA-binding transcriptional LysR family regulator
MDLQRLERFVLLAKKRNFSRAADQLNIPQSHLSLQIQQLERELNVRLFNRDRRPIELTAAGKVFLEEIERLLAQVDRAKLAAQRASRGETGRLIIGINTSISNSLLPSVLQIFRQEFPDVELVLQELLFEESRRRILEGAIDVDFENVHNLQDVDEEHPLTYEVICQEPLVLVLPEKHLLAHQATVRLEDLAKESFVLPSRDSVRALHYLTRRILAAAGVHPQVAQEATWMPTVLALVAGGVGVALLPANVMNLRRTGVVYREIVGLPPVFQLAMVWRRDNSSQILPNFIEVVRRVAQDSLISSSSFIEF